MGLFQRRQGKKTKKRRKWQKTLTISSAFLLTLIAKALSQEHPAVPLRDINGNLISNELNENDSITIGTTTYYAEPPVSWEATCGKCHEETWDENTDGDGFFSSVDYQDSQVDGDLFSYTQDEYSRGYVGKPRKSLTGKGRAQLLYNSRKRFLNNSYCYCFNRRRRRRLFNQSSSKCFLCTCKLGSSPFWPCSSLWI